MYYKSPKLKFLVCHIGHEVVGSGGERPEPVFVFVQVDLDAGENLVVEQLGDVLGQPVGVGREDARKASLLGHTNILHLHEERHLTNKGCAKLDGSFRFH